MLGKLVMFLVCVVHPLLWGIVAWWLRGRFDRRRYE